MAVIMVSVSDTASVGQHRALINTEEVLRLYIKEGKYIVHPL